MRPTDPVSIGEALAEFFAKRKLSQGSIEGRAVELWAEVVGDFVAEATEDVYIRSGVIYVHFSSPSIRADVMTRRNFIVSELNERLGSRAVRAIVLR